MLIQKQVSLIYMTTDPILIVKMQIYNKQFNKSDSIVSTKGKSLVKLTLYGSPPFQYEKQIKYSLRFFCGRQDNWVINVLTLH